MSQNEDDALPPAPQPQHERVWRHPSELGFAAHTSRVEQRPDIGRTGRGLLLFSLVAGSILLLGLVVMVQPRTAETDAVGVIDLTSRSVEVVELQGPNGKDPMAMVVGDGAYLVTTWAAIDSTADATFTAIDPRDGRRRRASVYYGDENLHLVVLRVGDIDAGRIDTLPAKAEVAMGHGVIVADGAGRPFSVGRRTDDGLVILDGSAPSGTNMTEGAPVLDRFGGLMGLYTEENTEPCFIPIEDVENLLRDLARD